ncbi:proline--tRNA ligase [archaeon CG10_big_fil_rev_8_21_14_0_10_43_11]|nr:MAG: proline--tRNA ligase [archaeon CG10_big_fil_rev_8_21_14_0_10_43_11]
MSKQEGITVKREENWDKWYPQICLKAELMDYSPVSGCYILRPRGYYLWEALQTYLDAAFKKSGVQNAYFPLFIPESLLKKEAEHVEGFTPEVAWVTHAGNSKLPERLAIRPTSETIMYNSYKEWIRSHRDLPLRLNQWNNVVRWEFKNPVLLMRYREFLWQEGHTVFATKQEADAEVREMLEIYRKAYEDVLALPMYAGMKTDYEKFPGADYTTSVEIFLPNGRGVQAATSHHLGQRFAKAFDITFKDESGKQVYPYQNSWGFATRALGIVAFMHSDDKGLVLPPRAAEKQIVIVPIFNADNKEIVLKEAGKLAKKLSEFRVFIDDREGYTPGWKFNEWELKGLPLRIEIGMRDIQNKSAVAVKRNDGKKQTVKMVSIAKDTECLLDTIHAELLENAWKKMHLVMVEVNTVTDLKKALANKKVGVAGWCGETDCEVALKEKIGARSSNYAFNKEPINTSCIVCKKPAKHVMRFAKYY